MNLLRHIAVTLLFTLFYSVTTAQVQFEKSSHDFGRIAEDGGVVEHIFRFRNISDSPIVIVSTYSSCGCTKAEFSRKPVMPDSTAVIRVIFNPMNYPGAFARKVTVVTDSGALKERLLVTGVVIPRKKSVEEEFPIALVGGVRAATNAHYFGYIEHGKTHQSTFDIYNSSKQEVSIAIENPYSELEFYLPPKIEAGERTTINFGCLLPENSAKYGSLSYSVWLIVDGIRAQYPFIINGLAIDSRNENANNSVQMIVVSENCIKFGAVKCNSEKLVRKIVVSNGGTTPLTIRKVELESDGFTANLEGYGTLEKGEKREVIVELKPSRLPFGATVEKLRIVSNDPKRPVVTIRVSAIVEK